MKFLTCEPNLKSISDYQDEADLFYENVPGWFMKNRQMVKETSFIVMFQNLYEQTKDELNDFKICKKFFHSFIQQSARTHQYLLLLCSKNNFLDHEKNFNSKIKTDL